MSQRNPIAGIAMALSLIEPISRLIAEGRERRQLRKAAKAAQQSGTVAVPVQVDRQAITGQVATVVGSAQLTAGAALQTISEMAATNPLNLPPELAEAPLWAQALHVALICMGSVLVLYGRKLQKPHSDGLQL